MTNLSYNKTLIIISIILIIITLIDLFRCILYNNNDKTLIIKHNNIKSRYLFRILIFLISLLFLFIGHSNPVILGIFASALVWSIVEFFDEIIDSCSIFEKERNDFYSDINDHLSNIKDIIKIDYVTLNYEAINKELRTLMDLIVNCQNKYTVFVLSKEFLSVHNYFLCLQEMVEEFYKNRSKEVYNILIHSNNETIEFESLSNEINKQKPKPFEFINPTFSNNEIYKLHNLSNNNEGDVSFKIHFEFPEFKSNKNFLTFKPSYDLKIFQLNNVNNTFVSVLYIVFFSKWFK